MGPIYCCFNDTPVRPLLFGTSINLNVYTLTWLSRKPVLSLHPLADATIASVTVTMNASISLGISSPYVSCSTSAQAALLRVGGRMSGVHCRRRVHGGWAHEWVHGRRVHGRWAHEWAGLWVHEWCMGCMSGRACGCMSGAWGAWDA